MGTAPAAQDCAAARALAAALAADERAAIARLVYVDDSGPGWRRARRGNAFVYFDQHDRRITDEDALRRIARLAIPPAYTDVWICPDPDGHLQATGRDARGRKQYRYHELWQQARGATKFERMREFGLALPRIRRAVQRHLAQRGLTRERVLATIVRLLDTTYLRVGNDEYARENGSFGLTTLRNRHAAVRGDTLRLSFRGKSGVRQQVELDDPQVARIVRKLQDVPGQELFQWLDDEGQPRGIGSAEVNDYLRSLSGGDFTAKDFRTWHASALALQQLHPCSCEDAKQAKLRIQQVITEVAARLGHTVSVCRKSYVHPQVLERFVEGRLQAMCEGRNPAPARLRGLKEAEKQLLALISRRPGAARAAGRGRSAAAELSASREAARPARSAVRPTDARGRSPARQTSSA